MSMNVHCNLFDMRQTTTEETDEIMGVGVWDLYDDDAIEGLRRYLHILLREVHIEDNDAVAEFAEYVAKVCYAMYEERCELTRR